MAFECARIKVSFVIKGKKAERRPNYANRLAVQKLDNDVDHAHPSPGKTEQAVACRIPEHLLELCVRQAIQTVVLVEQKSAA